MQMPKTRLNRSRSVIFLSAAAVAAFFVWAGFAEIDQVSRAAGQVIPAGRLQIIQSMDGGEISAIFVREGDFVKKGQVLVSLDQTKIAPAVEEGKAKVAALMSVKARIEAELFERPLAFPAPVMAFPEFIANQRQLYGKRRNAIQQDIAALERMRVLVQRELDMNRPLVEFGDVSKSEMLRLERSVADIEGQIASRRNKYLQDLQAEYTKAEEDLFTAEQVLKQREASLIDTQLRAPTDGIVKNVRLTTIGAVLRPGDEVLQIVPSNQKLIIEAKVSPADIAHVKVGQSASVKFDAYDSSIYGSVPGKVIYLSPDTLVEQKAQGEQVFYRVHIDADASQLRQRKGETISIQPGMIASAEIRTGRNTVLKYLLKPLIKTIQGSLGER